MIVVYENACKQAVENEEITKEQAAKVRNYYKGQQKSRKKKEKTKEKHNIIINSLEKMIEDGKFGDETLGSLVENTEDRAMKNMDMEHLQECLGRLSESDRRIIETIYAIDPKKVNIAAAARELDMPWSTVKDAHERILEALRKDFFK